MDIFWKNPVSADFDTSGDWSSGTVPGTFDIAKMTVAGTYTVFNFNPTTVFGITIGANTTLSVQSNFIAKEGTPTGANRGIISIANGATFDAGGAINNIGTIDLNAAGTATVLGINGTLEGGGHVSLTDDPNNQIGGAFTNVNNTISGAGTINAEVHNRSLGVIDATSNTNPLVLTAPVTNAGLLKATGSAGLEFHANITNAATGVIEAGAGTEANLFNGFVITGGTLKADSTGFFNVQAGNFTLDGSNAVVPTNTMLTISGQMFMHSGCNMTLKGTINNTGEIVVGAPADLFVDSAGTLTHVILEGKGTVSLSDSFPPSLITGEGFDAPVVTLVNVNNDIFGAGTIGGGNMALNNEAGGIIDATGTNPLIIDTELNVVTNAGSLNADAGAELFIDSSLVNTGHLNSFGSTIVAAGNVTGTGTAIINLDGQVEFGAASSNGTKFATGSTGELILDDSKQYTGTVSGFGTNITQSIDLTDIAFAGVTKSYASASPNTSGTLTIKDGAGDIAHIKFSGTYTLASFHLADDGNGGVLITDPPVESKPQTSDVALLGNYMASMFASASHGHGAIPTSWMDTPVPQLMSLPHA